MEYTGNFLHLGQEYGVIRKDGTVLSWSDWEEYPDIGGWENNAQLFSFYEDGYFQIIGLKSDGTLVSSIAP